MSKITDRYTSAVHSSNLKSSTLTVQSDSDVLGAYGIANRRLTAGVDENGDPTYSKHPLAVPLERLFAGDSNAASEIIVILAGVIRGKAQSMHIKMAEVQATDMARAAVGWFRAPSCQVCRGHGYALIPGTTTLGDAACDPCAGTGRVIFEELYRAEWRELVRWVMASLEKEAGLAGPAAMKAIAPSLEL